VCKICDTDDQNEITDCKKSKRHGGLQGET
jgi:hypothetical protein